MLGSTNASGGASGFRTMFPEHVAHEQSVQRRAVSEMISDQVKVREVVAVLPSRVALDAAVDTLLLAAIDRADIDFMVGLAPVRENLGMADEEDADSADAPQLSRASYIASANVIAIEIVVASTFASIGSIAAALTVASSGGGFGWATIAAGGSALVSLVLGSSRQRSFSGKEAS
jgi:hypothetical protein